MRGCGGGGSQLPADGPHQPASPRGLRRVVAAEFPSKNPFLDNQGRLLEGLKPLKEPAGRTRFLSSEEIERLLAASEFEGATLLLTKGYLRSFLVAGLVTGMRRDEILSLTRRSLDLNN
jgi:integrase